MSWRALLHMLCTCLDQVRSDESRTPRYLKVGTDSSGDPIKHMGGLGVVLFLLLDTSINLHLALLNCIEFILAHSLIMSMSC